MKRVLQAIALLSSGGLLLAVTCTAQSRNTPAPPASAPTTAAPTKAAEPGPPVVLPASKAGPVFFPGKAPPPQPVPPRQAPVQATQQAPQ